MNAITSSLPGSTTLATDLGRSTRRTPAATPTATSVDSATLSVADANRSAALGSIDDLAGAQSAVALMKLAFATQATAARAAQGSPSPEKALRLLGA